MDSSVCRRIGLTWMGQDVDKLDEARKPGQGHGARGRLASLRGLAGSGGACLVVIAATGREGGHAGSFTRERSKLPAPAMLALVLPISSSTPRRFWKIDHGACIAIGFTPSQGSVEANASQGVHARDDEEIFRIGAGFFGDLGGFRHAFIGESPTRTGRGVPLKNPVLSVTFGYGLSENGPWPPRATGPEGCRPGPRDRCRKGSRWGRSAGRSG